MAALQKRHASALESQHVSFQEEKQRVLIETEASAPEAALVQAYEGREDDANGHSAYRSRVQKSTHCYLKRTHEFENISA